MCTCSTKVKTNYEAEMTHFCNIKAVITIMIAQSHVVTASSLLKLDALTRVPAL